MKRCLAIEIKGEVHILNTEELDGLADNNIPYKTLGEVCDDKGFGDNCTTDCLLFCKGICPSVFIRDKKGQLWHLLKF